ncbi:glutamate receptor: ionotropic kainate 3-like protein 1, partial [Leptotrombidium deliense]
AYNKTLLEYPRKWLVIFTNVVKRKRYWNKMSPLFALSNTAIVQREVSEYGHCHELKEGCQMKLAFEIFKEATKKVASETEYDFTDLDMKRRTKNRMLAELRLLLGNDETFAQYCGNCDRYVLQVYETDKKRKSTKSAKPEISWIDSGVDLDPRNVKISRSGHWTPFKGLLEASERVSRKFEGGNLGGREVKVGIVEQFPLINVYYEKNNVCNVSGVTVEMLYLLSWRMNFTIKWVCDPKVRELGIYNEKTKQWTGMIGKLARKEIEMTGNGYWKSIEMMESGKFAFTDPYDVENVGIIVKKAIEDHPFLFTTPFTWDTWFCIFGSFAIIGPLLWSVQTFSRYYDFYNLRDGKGFFRLDNCIWYCYGAFLQQGGDHLPWAISGRVAIAFWWMYVTVTVTLYSGNMVALLTFPKIIQPIENAGDLMDAWFMSHGTIKDDPIQVMTKEAMYGPLVDLRKRMHYYKFPEEKDKVLTWVGWGFLGFIAREHEARHWISQRYYQENFCSMFFAKEPVLTMPVHFVLRNDVSKGMMDQINEELYIMTRSGVAQYWKQIFQEPGNDCMYPFVIHAGDVKKVQVKHMIGAFYILSGGLVAAILAMFCEIIHFCRLRVRRPDTRPLTFTQWLRKWYIRLTTGQLYADWYERNSDGTAKEKVAKSSPIAQAGGYNDDRYGKSWGNGQRPKIFSTVYGMQYGAVYGNQLSTMYNTKENFNYFAFDPSKKGNNTGKQNLNLPNINKP